ncbi:MAG: hypothetical protein J5752_10470 [Clostridiales bacterium]|nr:hypothetical protein [Clostridiales bacterium]
MTEKKSLREVFETNEQAREQTKHILASRSVVAVIALVGMIVAAVMFGIGIHDRDGSKISIFGLMTLMCASSFVSALKGLKKKE